MARLRLGAQLLLREKQERKISTDPEQRVFHVLIFTETALPALFLTILTALAFTQPRMVVPGFFRFARFRFLAMAYAPLAVL